MSFPSSYTSRPVSKQQRPSSATLVFKGVLFNVWQWEQILFDGTKKTFEKIERPDTVLVLPILPDGLVILAEETQPGMQSTLQAIGGRIEPGGDFPKRLHDVSYLRKVDI